MVLSQEDELINFTIFGFLGIWILNKPTYISTFGPPSSLHGIKHAKWYIITR